MQKSLRGKGSAEGRGQQEGRGQETILDRTMVIQTLPNEETHEWGQVLHIAEFQKLDPGEGGPANFFPTDGKPMKLSKQVKANRL